MGDEQVTLKTGIETAFDNLIFMADEYIKVDTARALALELGIQDFDPENYDH